MREENESALQKPVYSIVAPVHNEEAVLHELYRRISEVMAQAGEPWELVLVDDGSRDRSAEVIAELHDNDPRVRGIILSRNFTFQIAVTAGLEHASGDAVVLIDADLQDPPEVVLEMIQKWKEGYEVVYGVRSSRDGETWFKRVTASAFYRIINRITGIKIPVDTGDFRLMDRLVVNSVLQMPEHNRFLRGMVTWVGYKQTGIYYERQARFAGETKFTVRRMTRFAMDAITGFSYFPLQLATYFGFITAVISAIAIILVILLRLFTPGEALLGQATTLVTVLFLGSVQLISLGIIGEYLGRIYDEVRGRPLYLVNKKYGFTEDEGVKGS
ncbi:MAG: glycosyltransferase family 2 protein [Anaerolineales bacterium]|nr:glycosyltransferase family 2 protein [Anaerolineales bacterium]